MIARRRPSSGCRRGGGRRRRDRRSAHLAALSLHLAFFGCAIGALALALAAATGRKAVAAGGAAAFAVARLPRQRLRAAGRRARWLKYLSLFYYYEGHDPIGNGVDVPDLAVLAVATIVLTAVAVYGMRDRDLRG